MNRLALGLALACLSGAGASAQDSVGRPWQDCAGENPDRGLAGCTEVLTRKTGLSLEDRVFAHLSRGLNRVVKGDFDQGLADFEQAIGLKPNSAEAYYFQGLTRRDKGELQRAIADLDQAIRLKPDYAEAYFDRGAIRLNRGEDERAILDLDQAIRFRPDYAEAYVSRAGVRVRQGEFGSAISDLGQAIRLKPNDADAYRLRASAFFYRGDHTRALSDLNEAIRLRPGSSGLALGDRCEVAAVMGALEAALADCDQALMLDPANAEALAYRGLIRLKQGDGGRAMADLNQAVKLGPARSEPYGYRAAAHFEMRDFGPALYDYEAALRLAPQHPYFRAGRDRLLAAIAFASAPSVRRSIAIACEQARPSNPLDSSRSNTCGADRRPDPAPKHSRTSRPPP